MKGYLLLVQEGTDSDGLYCDVKIFDVSETALADLKPCKLVSHEAFNGKTREEAFHLAAETAVFNINITEDS